MSIQPKRLLALVALLAGCAVQQPAPETTISPPGPTAAPRSENAAVASLMDSARADTAAGRLANASSALERALRIEPRNPRLWQELARVRLQQGEYAQAENLAVRSSAWAADDNALRAENWRIIAQAREGRGDAAGARQALEAAERWR